MPLGNVSKLVRFMIFYTNSQSRPAGDSGGPRGPVGAPDRGGGDLRADALSTFLRVLAGLVPVWPGAG